MKKKPRFGLWGSKSSTSSQSSSSTVSSRSPSSSLNEKVKTESLVNEDETELAKQLEELNSQLSQSLLQKEDKKRAIFQKEEMKQQV